MINSRFDVVNQDLPIISSTEKTAVVWSKGQAGVHHSCVFSLHLDWGNWVLSPIDFCLVADGPQVDYVIHPILTVFHRPRTARLRHHQCDGMWKAEVKSDSLRWIASHLAVKAPCQSAERKPDDAYSSSAAACTVLLTNSLSALPTSILTF